MAHDTDGLAQRVTLIRARHFQCLSVNFVRCTGVVPERLRCAWDLEGLSPTEDLPSINGLQCCQFLHIFVNQICKLQQYLSPCLKKNIFEKYLATVTDSYYKKIRM